jgi:nitrate/TMAO reductase-like tetraheme cytochrome c subunit
VRAIVRPLWYLSNNRTSQLGITLTTASAITLLTLFTTDFFGVRLSPYAGAIAFLALPAVFLVGLVLIPLGMWRRRRCEARDGRLPAEYPPIDFRRADVREVFWFVAVMSGVNLVIFLAVTYKGVQQMETVEFCGATCHTVMQPEYTAYRATAHARVPCVECHIGPGAPWFVRSKLSGTYQVLAVTFDLYPRPIPVPIEHLRPSRDTCEQCHWPERFVGDKLLVKTHFGDQEKAAETKTVLLMHIGGVDQLTGKPLGNHGVHVQPGAEIRYAASDGARQEIPYVRYRRPDGTVVEYVATEKGKPAPPAPDPATLRLMDCIDCHNRPAHVFELPDAAVDRVLAAGLVDPTLPYVKKLAVEALKAEYPTEEAARDLIRSRVAAFYRDGYPIVAHTRGAAIERAGEVLAAVWARNVFPAMKVGWGTYANNIGHQDFPGCFRCHDGLHSAADGRSIPSDCDTCHALLALDEADPAILKQLAGD